ncbi:hypothetical protein SCP_0301870 [Sparassis crispa]|uniref:BZIP domain-containing protein n=1 Tax=Sparassis crispa TaxID=139825 RepID=A0A401GE66_9APHY|nr:hypothetical protein SCP_0301870 [Sparassis crispa]GBE80472.1 hypothetical protein SCP_0301870 [Sparassis crispa]
MAPSHLQGLNIVHPPPPPNPYLSDADLLSVPPFPDLNAQLDLWTNLNFQSDEPAAPSSRGDSGKKDLGFDGNSRSPGDGSEDDGDRYDDLDDDVHNKGGVAEIGAHENVVTGTVLPPTGVAHRGNPGAQAGVNASDLPMPLDIGSLLAGFGLDPFLVPPVQQSAPQAASASSIAQLLSLHATTFRSPQMGNSQQPSQLPVPAQAPPTQSQQQQSQSQQSQASAPAPKRSRTTRLSVSSATPSQPDSALSPEADDRDPASPLTAAEDKRRRNTAASARFRLKKKEREAALERKAKDLEGRVSELEKECEALRRENGWLKGLVVGVTGAGAAQQQQQQVAVPARPAAGAKRSREDSETQSED